MPLSFRANALIDDAEAVSQHFADEVETQLLCREGAPVKLQDPRSLFLFNKGDLTTYLCCPKEHSECEQDWLEKLRKNPSHMDANSALCHSPDDVTCIVYTGDTKGKALVKCPPYPVTEFGTQQRHECNLMLGRWWPFPLNATLPINGGMPEVSEVKHAKYNRGDHLLHFVQDNEESTSLVQALRKEHGNLGFFISGECNDGDPANQKDGFYHRDWRTGCKTYYPDLAYNFLDQVPVNKTTWLITIVRNGLHQGISEFFMTWHRRLWPTRKGAGGPLLDYENFLKLTNEDLMDYYQEFVGVHNDWFQRFLTPLIGFDARTMKEPLQQDGYAFQQLRYGNGKTINLLILRFEAVAQWPVIMNKFFPLKPTAYPRQAATEQDGWRAHQDSFKKVLCEGNHLPTTMEESMKYQNMEFYNDTEVFGFVEELKTYCSGLRPVHPIWGAPDAGNGR
jgi:hypothetical protein